MASLPTPGGDNNTWGTRLNDYLLVAHNPNGTQIVEPFLIGTSYIVVQTGEVDGLEAGINLDPPPNWSLVAPVVGTDLEIDGTDAWKVNILNDGWYVLTQSFAFGTENNAIPLVSFIWDLAKNGVNISPDSSLNVENVAPAAGIKYWGETHATPYVQAVAGDYFSLNPGNIITTSAPGTYFIDQCRVQIMRVA